MPLASLVQRALAYDPDGDDDDFPHVPSDGPDPEGPEDDGIDTDNCAHNNGPGRLSGIGGVAETRDTSPSAAGELTPSISSRYTAAERLVAGTTWEWL